MYSVYGTLPVALTLRTDGAKWLSASLSSSTEPAILTISVNPTGLAVGTYTSIVTVTSSNTLTWIVSLSVTAASQPVAPATVGTVAFWHFEEGPAGGTAGGTGSIVDSSGHGLNGTPVGGPIYVLDSGSVPGSTLGLKFNGSSSRIFVPDSPLLQLTHSLTLDAYIRIDGPVTDPYGTQIIFRGDDRSALDPYTLSIAPSGQLCFDIYNASNQEAMLCSPNSLPTGVFVRVTASLDDATGTQRLFVNGSLVALGITNIRPFAQLDASQNPGLGIGSLQTGGQFFNGVIDEVNIRDDASFGVSSPGGGQLIVSPTSLTFSLSSTPSGAPLPAQNLSIASSATNVNFSAVVSTSGPNWLAVSPLSGTTPAMLSVSANGAGLTAGTYNGTIAVTAPGASDSPQNIPVTLTISSAPAISVSPSSLGFNDQITGTAPPNQTFTVLSSGTPLTAAAAVTSGFNWLSVTPASGTTPATFSVSAGTSGLAAGSYSGVIQITAQGVSNSPQNVSVTLTVTPPPAGSLTKIVNAADFLSGALAPGEIVTLAGTNIGLPTSASFASTPSGTVPTTLGNTQVLFDGLPAPLLYVSSGQVNAIVPYEVAGRASTSVQVSYNGILSNALVYQVQATAPGVFTASSSGTGQGAILNQDFTANGPSNPAAKGSVVQIFGTGEGQTSPANVTGSVNGSSILRFALQQVTAMVGGLPAVVQFAGEAPGLLAGIFQVNVVIPTDAPPGAASLVVTVGQNSTQPGVTVSVQ